MSDFATCPGPVLFPFAVNGVCVAMVGSVAATLSTSFEDVIAEDFERDPAEKLVMETFLYYFLPIFKFLWLVSEAAFDLPLVDGLSHYWAIAVGFFGSAKTSFTDFMVTVAEAVTILFHFVADAVISFLSNHTELIFYLVLPLLACLFILPLILKFFLVQIRNLVAKLVFRPQPLPDQRNQNGAVTHGGVVTTVYQPAPTTVRVGVFQPAPMGRHGRPLTDYVTVGGGNGNYVELKNTGHKNADPLPVWGHQTLTNYLSFAAPVPAPAPALRTQGPAQESDAKTVCKLPPQRPEKKRPGDDTVDVAAGTGKKPRAENRRTKLTAARYSQKLSELISSAAGKSRGKLQFRDSEQNGKLATFAKGFLDEARVDGSNEIGKKGTHMDALKICSFPENITPMDLHLYLFLGRQFAYGPYVTITDREVDFHVVAKKLNRKYTVVVVFQFTRPLDELDLEDLYIDGIAEMYCVRLSSIRKFQTKPLIQELRQKALYRNATFAEEGTVGLKWKEAVYFEDGEDKTAMWNNFADHVEKLKPVLNPAILPYVAAHYEVEFNDLDEVNQLAATKARIASDFSCYDYSEIFQAAYGEDLVRHLRGKK